MFIVSYFYIIIFLLFAIMDVKNIFFRSSVEWMALSITLLLLLPKNLETHGKVESEGK